MERTYIKDLKKGPVLVKGWIHELRDLAKIKFILLRDITGIVQCIIKDEKLFKKFSELTLESVISI
jgi:nondiscriminating aspartyl-tRNA synthetase